MYPNSKITALLMGFWAIALHTLRVQVELKVQGYVKAGTFDSTDGGNSG